MFLTRNIRRTNVQKQRISSRDVLLMHIIRENIKLYNFNFFIFAVQGGFLNTRTISYFFTYSKKLLYIGKKTTKVWLNLPSSHIITKKALNVRMGKGKGARLGINAKVYPGMRIFAIANARPGLCAKVYRFISVRCAFKVIFYKKVSNLHSSLFSTHNNQNLITPHVATNLLCVKAPKIMVKRYIAFQILELYTTLQRLKKIKLFIYFYKIFKTFFPKLYLYNKHSLLSFQFWGLYSTWILRAKWSRYYFFLIQCSHYYTEYAKGRGFISK